MKGSDKAWRVAPPTLANVEADRSRSIAAKLVLVDDPVVPTGGLVPGAVAVIRTGTVIAARSVPPSAVGHGAAALVSRPGSPLAAPLADFAAALAAPALRARGRAAAAAGAARQTRAAEAARASLAGAPLAAGQTVVLALPNADADAGIGAERPLLVVQAALARVVLLGAGGVLLGDLIAGPGAATEKVEVMRGTERIVAIGQGAAPPPRSASRALARRALRATDAVRAAADASAALVGWHAGAQMPYAGSGVALGPGVVVHASGENLALHRERRAAGWVGGAELARGVEHRRHHLRRAGAHGADRARRPRCRRQPRCRPPVAARPGRRHACARCRRHGTRAGAADTGQPQPPRLRRGARPGRCEPLGKPVVVTVASRRGWSLVGVMGSALLDAAGVIALIAARGLDAVLDAARPARARR